MVPRRVLALLIGAAVALGAPVGAFAQDAPDDLAPPVDPATEQYVEATPGDRTPRRLSDEDRRELERGDGDGAALIGAVEGAPASRDAATAPVGGSRDARPAAPVRSTLVPPAPATTDVPGGVDDASLGPVGLWLVLAALAVAGSAAAVVRWRRAS